MAAGGGNGWAVMATGEIEEERSKVVIKVRKGVQLYMGRWRWLARFF